MEVIVSMVIGCRSGLQVKRKTRHLLGAGASGGLPCLGNFVFLEGGDVGQLDGHIKLFSVLFLYSFISLQLVYTRIKAPSVVGGSADLKWWCPKG